jgi:flagellar hook-associated protein 1 FlgK
MSFLSIFEIGRTAVLATQTQLNVVGNNLANAATPGYNRQEVILDVVTPVTQGNQKIVVGQGVSVAAIRRQYDALLQNQINLAQQDYGQSSTLNQYLSSIDQIFNEAQNLGLATPLTDFFNAWQELANNPQGLTERSLVLQKTDSLINSAQQMEKGVTDTLTQINTGITSDVTKINDLATQIAKLNDQITQVEAGSGMGTSNSLRDKRDQVLKDLNYLIEAGSWEDSSSGALTVTVGQRNLVSGSSTKTLSAIASQNGAYTLKLDGMDITSQVTKGEIGGLSAASQDIRANLQDFRKLIASLANQVNLQHIQGFDLDALGGTSFFNPIQLTVVKTSASGNLTSSITDYSQLTMDEYAVNFVDDGSGGFNYQITNADTGALKTSGAYVAAGTTVNLEGIRFVLSGTVTAQDSFSVSPLTTAIQNFGKVVTDSRKIAASSSATSVPGNNVNALAVADIINNQISSLDSGTVVDFYQSLVGQIGSQTKTAIDSEVFAKNFLGQLTNKRDSISGVNMDEEAANLIRFQRAFQAAARLISTADELFQTLLNL